MRECFPVLCLFMISWILTRPTPVAGRRDRQYDRRTKVMRGFGDLIPADVNGKLSGNKSFSHVARIQPILELNSPCRSSYECLSYIPHSQCDHDSQVCVCQNYHVAFNSTMCLPASLLGFGCITDAQCQVKVQNSVCVDGLCGCEVNHIPLRRDKCLPPVPFGSYCLHDLQCAYYSQYSFCLYLLPRVYGRCQCPKGYHVNETGHCLPLLGSYCEKHEDCRAVTPHSYCATKGITHECDCINGYDVDNYECIRDRTTAVIAAASTTVHHSILSSLGKACTGDQECKARDPHSHCLNGTCECIAPDATCSAQNTGCHPETFQCRNGFCISWYFVCDGQMNCADQSDEDECQRYNCPKEAFTCDDGTCITRAAVCNGRWECPDGTDEARCYTGIPCDKNAYRCRNGQCFPRYAFCNAIQDCFDGSDEIAEVCNQGVNCTSVYEHSHQCANGHCRSSVIACSGLDGCGDESDEAKCEVCYCKKP